MEYNNISADSVLSPSLAGTGFTTPLPLVAELCRHAWGIEGDFTRLQSASDEVLRVDSANGSRFLLRLTSPRELPLVTDFQTRAVLHLNEVRQDLPVPRLIRTLDGRPMLRPDWPGAPCPAARLFTWLEGTSLHLTPRTADQAGALGMTLAHLGQALAGFDHPGAEHELDWDLCRTGRLAALLGEIRAAEDRILAERAMQRFQEQVAPRLTGLRRQVIHNDLNPHNVLVNPQAPQQITGIIDFGDLVKTILVADVAIAGAYLVCPGDNPLRLAEKLVTAYHTVQPLTAQEIELLVPLMEARHLMTIAITEWRAARNPDNRLSITKNTGQAWQALRALDLISHEESTARLRAACNMGS
jgi:Ser/Thr protein kinase RdoA (MazF antagonist)